MSTSEVGPWAAEKLERLRKYISAYTTVLSNQRWCEGFFYIDAFAGSGLHQIRHAEGPVDDAQQLLLQASEFAQEQLEQKSLLAGSPRVALEIARPFSHYTFIEKNPDRAAQLQQLATEFDGVRRISIVSEDCNAFLLSRVVSSQKVSWKSHRALVFLDPFGMQVPWSTIEALAATGPGAIEIFLNFPVGMAIQRLLPRKPQFSDEMRLKLDLYFGSDDWFDLLYKKKRGLFEDDDPRKVENSGAVLVEWYRERLKRAFGHASQPLLIRNTRGAHLYYLLVASGNATGVRIANDVLSE